MTLYKKSASAMSCGANLQVNNSWHGAQPLSIHLRIRDGFLGLNGAAKHPPGSSLGSSLNSLRNPFNRCPENFLGFCWDGNSTGGRVWNWNGCIPSRLAWWSTAAMPAASSSQSSKYDNRSQGAMRRLAVICFLKLQTQIKKKLCFLETPHNKSKKKKKLHRKTNCK